MKVDRLVRRAQASVAQSQTDAVIWPAEAGYRILVVSAYALTPTATALTVNSKPSGSAGVAVTPAFTAAGGTPTIDWAPNENGWCSTLPGEALTVTTGAGGTTAVVMTLSLEPAIDGIYDERMQPLLTEDNQPLASEAA